MVLFCCFHSFAVNVMNCVFCFVSGEWECVICLPIVKLQQVYGNTTMEDPMLSSVVRIQTTTNWLAVHSLLALIQTIISMKEFV